MSLALNGTALASGLDTDSIVASLMSLESAGKTRLQLKQIAIEARKTDLNAVTSKLNAVKLAADDLKSVATWADTQTVTSSDTAVSATRTGGVGPGGYEVVVTQLAAAERRTYGFTPNAAATQLSVLDKDGNGKSTIDLAAGATLEDAVAAINGSSTAGVYAAAVDGSLVLSSKKTGSAGSFSLTGAGAQTDVVAALDAQGTVSGRPFSQSSNVLTNVVPGLTLTLKAKTAGTGVTVGDPQPDTDAVKTKLKSFVTAYNAAVDTLRTNLTEQRVPAATTSTDVSKGQLFGDSTLSAALSALRQSVSEPLAGLTGSITSLADLGISTGAATATTSADAKAGKLTFDETKFNSAITDNPLGVQKLLAGSDTVTGFGARLGAVITPYSGTDGIFASRLTSADSEISTIKDSLGRFDARLDLRETQLRKQFAALEAAMSASQSMSAKLTASLGIS